jgi:hypothetical protein
MPRIPSPLHDKSVPGRVSKPTVTAQAAATVAESAVAPAARKTRLAKSKAAPAAKKAVPAKRAAASATRAKPAPARKAKAAAPAKAKAKTEAPAPATAKVKEKATPAAAAAAPVAAKPAKVHKPKLVRDSFTIPKDEYAVLAALKSRALGLGQHVRKSELLRAGIQALGAMGDAAFLDAVGAVPTLKTGRPRKG